MVNVYIAENKDKNEFLNNVLLRHTTAPITILRSPEGKPYIQNNPIYFNVTHSGAYIVVAVSESPVGIDMETYGKGIRRVVLSKFSKREQEEISSEKDFLTHWTAREAFIKYKGDTLAHMLKLTEFTGGRLYVNCLPVTPYPRFYYTEKFVLSVCGEGEIIYNTI